MQLDKKIEHLIITTSNHLTNDVLLSECKTVSNQAIDCIEEVVGLDHPYTNLIKHAAHEGGKTALLTVSGVLWAAKLSAENERHS